MRLFKDFTFEAAHFLPWAPKGHPNARVHGHSFHVRVTVSGRPDPETGLIVHFEEFEKAIGVVKEKLDHRFLNEVPGLDKPTLERLAAWIWDDLKPVLPGLAEVAISRPSCGEGCITNGEGHG